jgi:hypothetical protein
VKFECRKVTSKYAINTLFNKFETTGSVMEYKKGFASKKSVTTPENIPHVELALKQTPTTKYVKCPSQRLSLGASSTNDN